MLTVQYAKPLPHIKFNAVEPGFTATDLTAAVGGGQPVAEGAAPAPHRTGAAAACPGRQRCAHRRR